MPKSLALSHSGQASPLSSFGQCGRTSQRLSSSCGDRKASLVPVSIQAPPWSSIPESASIISDFRIPKEQPTRTLGPTDQSRAVNGLPRAPNDERPPRKPNLIHLRLSSLAFCLRLLGTQPPTGLLRLRIQRILHLELVGDVEIVLRRRTVQVVAGKNAA